MKKKTIFLLSIAILLVVLFPGYAIALVLFLVGFGFLVGMIAMFVASLKETCNTDKL